MNSKAALLNNNFGQLYQQHRDKLLNRTTAMVRNRDQAEDVTSAAFGKAYQHFDGFRGDAAFATWVYAIAANAVASSHRGQQRQRTQQLPEELTGPDSVADDLDRAEVRARLHAALARLPERYGQVLIDHFILGTSVRQIAKRERIPVGTVLSRIFTAKRLLRQAWKP